MPATVAGSASVERGGGPGREVLGGDARDSYTRFNCSRTGFCQESQCRPVMYFSMCRTSDGPTLHNSLRKAQSRAYFVVDETRRKRNWWTENGRKPDHECAAGFQGLTLVEAGRWASGPAVRAMLS